MYQRILNKNNITSPMCIWNVDETGCLDVPGKPRKNRVLSHKERRANVIVVKEKGETITAIVMANTIRLKAPPMIIHKGSRLRAEWSTNVNEAIV